MLDCLYVKINEDHFDVRQKTVFEILKNSKVAFGIRSLGVSTSEDGDANATGLEICCFD